MNTISDWIVSRPLWLQFVIALFVFFTIIPSITGILGLIFLKLQDTIEILFARTQPFISAVSVAVFMTLFYLGLWDTLGELSWRLSNSLRIILPSSQEKFEMAHQMLFSIIALLFAIGFCIVSWLWIRRIIRKHRQAQLSSVDA